MRIRTLSLLGAVSAGVVALAACGLDRSAQPVLISWDEAEDELAAPVATLDGRGDVVETRARAAEVTRAGERDVIATETTDDETFVARAEPDSLLAATDDVPVLTNLDGPLRMQFEGYTVYSDRDPRRTDDADLPAGDAEPLAFDETAAARERAAGTAGRATAGAGTTTAGTTGATATGPVDIRITIDPAAGQAEVEGVEQRARAAETTPAQASSARQGLGAPVPSADQRTGPISSAGYDRFQEQRPGTVDNPDLPGVIDDPSGVDVPELGDNVAVFGPALGGVGTVGVAAPGTIGDPVGVGGLRSFDTPGVGVGEAPGRNAVTGGRQTAEQLATPPGRFEPRRETVEQLATPEALRQVDPGRTDIDSARGPGIPASAAGAGRASLLGPTGAVEGVVSAVPTANDGVVLEAAGLPPGRHGAFLVPPQACLSGGGALGTFVTPGARVGTFIVGDAGRTAFVPQGTDLLESGIGGLQGQALAVVYDVEGRGDLGGAGALAGAACGPLGF